MIESNPPQSGRPPPRVLLIHNGMDVTTHVAYLSDRGLRVSDSHCDDAIARALAVMPDVIVLDYDCERDVLAQLKADFRTRHIPVIALKDLPDTR